MPPTLKRSWFVLPGRLAPLTLPGAESRFSDAFARKLIRLFTKRGDRILDPFMGFGTTILAAQQLGRIGVGIERMRRRVAYVRPLLQSPSSILKADAMRLFQLDLSKFDLCLTSPPYLRSTDNENPFSGKARRGNYRKYLLDIENIFRQVKCLMKPRAAIVVEVANTFHNGRPMTPLAWDVAKILSRLFWFEREYIHCTTDAPPAVGTDHSYVLIFRNK
jgi:DNA modification methylase